MDSNVDQLKFEMGILRTKVWVLQHRIPSDVILKMSALILTAPRNIFDRDTEAACRWLYTEAMKNG